MAVSKLQYHNNYQCVWLNKELVTHRTFIDCLFPFEAGHGSDYVPRTTLQNSKYTSAKIKLERTFWKRVFK